MPRNLALRRLAVRFVRSIGVLHERRLSGRGSREPYDVATCKSTRFRNMDLFLTRTEVEYNFCTHKVNNTATRLHLDYSCKNVCQTCIVILCFRVQEKLVKLLDVLGYNYRIHGFVITAKSFMVGYKILLFHCTMCLHIV